MPTFSLVRSLILTATLLLAAGGTQASTAPPPGMRLERVVLLMRHGVRPPTKTPPLPAGYTAEIWPNWPVKPGYLTPHGAEAVRLLGRWDRSRYATLFSAGACPLSGEVAVISDSDERTIRTGDSYLEGLAPGCAIANAHKPQDVADPLFSPIDAGAVRFDPAQARTAILAGLPKNGLSEVDAAQARGYRLLDRIYGCCAAALCPPDAQSSCGFGRIGSDLAPPSSGKRPKLIGALDVASTAAHVLLLEYADGKPMSEVGWGRASRADITALSRFHALEFQLLARPTYVAAANIAPIATRMVAALTDREAPRLLLLMGHDTNIASLGGLLGVHWQAPGYARDDPPPGGALGIELLRDRTGKRFVRAVFRAQGLDELRYLKPLKRDRGYAIAARIDGCPAVLCPLEVLQRVVAERTADVMPGTNTAH